LLNNAVFENKSEKQNVFHRMQDNIVDIKADHLAHEARVEA
jgi:hypothetical protein